MSAQPVRVGVLGAGAIAQVAHLPILSRMRGVELVALCDPDRSKMSSIAGRFAIPRLYGSPEELWDDPEVHAVVVCTPNHLHEEQARAGLEAGKYVLCEKPLALTRDGIDRVLATPGADERLMVGMNQRYRPDAAALKTFLAGRELGDVFYLRAGWLNRRIGRSRKGWRYKKATAGGGALMDLGIQMLDLALWLLDFPDPVRVTAQLSREAGSEVESSAVLLLELTGNQILNLEVTWNLVSDRERQYLHLLGSTGSASLSPLTVFKEMESGLANVTPASSPSRENLYTASYRQELAAFMELVRGERPGRAPSGQRLLMQIVEGAYRSADEGREVVF